MIFTREPWFERLEEVNERVKEKWKEKNRDRSHSESLGRSHTIRARRRLARKGGSVLGGGRLRGGRRSMGTDGLHPPLQRRCPGHRRQGRAHRGGARAGRRPGEQGTGGSQGPLRLAGQQLRR